MAIGQRKEACTERQSMALLNVSAECSGGRLRAVLSECKISPMDFALFLKISPQRLNNWFARGIPHSQLDRIARLLSVNAHWLKTGG
ncbi:MULTISPECIES: XRE family transcriptional regulator [Pseudomonas]|nr:XRE family transcriptional regulator [Pseudomonas synxantha]